MNNYKYAFSLVFILFMSFSAQGQRKVTPETEKYSLNSGTLDNQFEFVMRRSYDYKEYKSVKKVWLYALKAHTMDTLKALHNEINTSEAKINKQTTEISTLKQSLSKTQDSLELTNSEKDSMALFGMQMSKTGYNALMWTVIAGLLALALLFAFKFKDSNSITRQAKLALSETEEEFEEHRRIALEREQKVRRQLQDEINKHKSSI